jgi:predicted ATP-grasp superfamily ATP-dependent carboligase
VFVSDATTASRPSVLVGFAEAAAAPEVVWSLVDAGFQVVAFARKGRPSALRRSRHVACFDVRAPEIDTAGALSDLASVLESVGGAPRVLFPLDDTAVWLCSRVELPEGWRLAGPSGESAELALNKRLQVEAAARAGFDVPRTHVVSTSEELRRAVGEYPIILKGAECAAQRDGRLVGCRTWICGDREELERAIAQWAERVPLLVQPFIEGIGEGVFGLATPDGVRAWSSHRRLRMMNPQGSGSSACISQAVPDDLKAKAATLVDQTQWRGLFMIELLRDKAGRAWFVELNGRPWGSMALARRQGLEYPAWQVGIAIDAGSPAGTVNGAGDGLICRHIGRELMHLAFVLRGPRSTALRRWPSIWSAIGGVIGIRPGDGLYNWRRDDPAVFISDCYYTVHDNLFKTSR